MAKPSSGGTGCLVLFCLPFATVGVVMLGLVLWNLADAIAMRSWRETPATIHSLELRSHPDNEGGTTYDVVAAYSYAYYGQTFESDRVAIGSGADNIGTYWQDLYHRLNEARANAAAVCFVNPNNPAEAVLDPALRWGMIAFKATFALVFGGVGFGLGIGAIVMARRARAKARLKAEAPDQVWSADPRWRDGVIRAEGSGTAWILIGITIFWNALSWPVVIFGIPEMINDKEYWPILFVIPFPLVGLALATASLYTLLRSFKYGRPLLKPPQLPLRGGQRIEAQVTGTRIVEALGPLSCDLICGQMVTSGSGKNQRTSEHILWKHQWTMDADRMERGIEGWSMPISLPLPADVDITDDDRNIAWRLELRAPTAGIDFFARFPLPVVAGNPGDDALTRASVGEAAVAAMNDETLERLYQKAGLQRTASPGSLRLVSPPFRLRGGSIAMVAFGLIFGGFGSGIGLLIGLEGRTLNWGPLILGGIFALIGLLVVWGGITSFLRTFHVEVDRHGIVLRKGLFSPGAALRHERANISAIAVREVYSTNGVPRCRITIEPSQGRSIALTPVVGDTQEAEMIAADIRAALG